MADREPDDLLGALPRTRPQRRARRDRAATGGDAAAGRGGNRPKAAPGSRSGAVSRADAAQAEPVGPPATSAGLAPDAAESQHKAAPATAKPPARAAKAPAGGAAKARPSTAKAGGGRAQAAGGAAKARPGTAKAGGRRSDAARRTGAQGARPRHVRAVPDPTPPVPPAGWSTPAPERGRTDVVGAAVQAVGELAQLGVAIGGATLRGVLRRLPRP